MTCYLELDLTDCLLPTVTPDATGALVVVAAAPAWLDPVVEKRVRFTVEQLVRLFELASVVTQEG
jgi:hypothetical protein